MDKRITELDALTTLTSDDILVVVDAPSTTPVNKKITVEDFLGTIQVSLVPNTDSAINLGSDTKYWANLYSDKIYLNATATIDGTAAGVITVSSGIVVSGTITDNTSGNISALGGYVYARGIINESTTTAGIYMGYGSTNDTPRFLLANGTASQNFQIDNNSGIMRFFSPSNVIMALTTTSIIVYYQITTNSNANLSLVPNGTGYTIIGNAGTTSHSFNTNDDLLVSGRLEVDGTVYLDGDLHVGVAQYIEAWNPVLSIDNYGNVQNYSSHFDLNNKVSSLGDYAGVRIGANIMDAGITRVDFVIDRLDYTATYKSALMHISLNDNTTIFSTSLSSTVSVGYSTGAGGTISQSTNKSTGVTLNKITGTITMHNETIAGYGAKEFTVTNSTVAATDIPVVAIKSGATAASYLLSVTAVGTGSFNICVYNLTAGDLSEALVLSFAIIKGVAA